MQFTRSEYEGFLTDLLQKEYSFNAFPEAPGLLEQKKKFILLRHDVDFDLGRAVKMAEIDAKHGIRSTFFFLLRTEHYNMFSKADSDATKRILSLGHYFGLHFDASLYPAEESSRLSTKVRAEANLLETWFEEKISAVSFHRPGPHVLTGDPKLTEPYVHTYMDIFTKKIFYCADSKGCFRFGQPEDSSAYRECQPMHLGFHPLWWNEVESTPLQTLKTLFQEKNDRLHDSFAANCVVYPKSPTEVAT